jgi:hypothetical protein
MGCISISKEFCMKNKFGLFGIIALIAVVGFSMAVCDDTSGKTHTHDFNGEWHKDVTQHWHECSCGEKTDIANHQWGAWEVTTPASTTAAGEETRECTVCEKTETQPIAKLPKCECPAGTIHLTGEDDCDSETECTCEHDVEGKRLANGIAVIKGTGVTYFTEAYNSVKSAFELLEEADAEGVIGDVLTVIMNTVKIIQFVPYTGTGTYEGESTVLSNIVKINEARGDGEMAGLLYNLAGGE